MGIPFYFATLAKRHAGITSIVKKNARINVDVLAIDFNCLIHRYLKDGQPIQSILDALEHIVTEICHGKQLYIAMDGVVPYAKIVQQRYRRFRIRTDVSSGFDRHQISPGTPYMKELEEGIRARFPTCVMSSTLEEGEGEHKMFSWIGGLPASERKSVCVYGLDADLILLALSRSDLSQSNQMWLLRESGEFDDPKLKEAEFAILSVWKLKTVLPISIEQYIPLCVLCFGNDFMPNLAMFSLREDGYDRALSIYSKCGSPNMTTTEGRNIFLKSASLEEMNVLRDRIQRRKQPLEKTILGKDNALFSQKYGLHVLDGVLDMYPVVVAFWRTFHWTLDYFQTNTTNNWAWVYPYPDAPLISDIIEYPESNAGIPCPKSFDIGEQLRFILPAKSLRAAKRRVVYHDELHSETRHPWMKRHDWEMKPRISLPWNPTGELTTVSPL
jgi:5'-3' exonuclease